MPFMSGSNTPSTALVAIAASTAEPPRDRISAPACEACTWLLATMPYGEITIDRAFVRSCANANVPRTSKRQDRNRGIFHSFDGRAFSVECPEDVNGRCEQGRCDWSTAGAVMRSQRPSPVRDNIARAFENWLVPTGVL